MIVTSVTNTEKWLANKTDTRIHSWFYIYIYLYIYIYIYIYLFIYIYINNTYTDIYNWLVKASNEMTGYDKYST